MRLGRSAPAMVAPEDALPGRDQPLEVHDRHLVLGRPITPPWPEETRLLVVGMGCFWGAERIYWQLRGVWTTFVGYAGGYTPNPTYTEVCSGRTGHAEVVGVVYDPGVIDVEQLLVPFWEQHDPTQVNRQGNDIGTQYRSAVFTFDEAQADEAQRSRLAYQEKLREAGLGAITTTVAPAPTFYYAEGYHQQYLWKNPNGYCGLGGTGIACPVGLFGPESA